MVHAQSERIIITAEIKLRYLFILFSFRFKPYVLDFGVYFLIYVNLIRTCSLSAESTLSLADYEIT